MKSSIFAAAVLVASAEVSFLAADHLTVHLSIGWHVTRKGKLPSICKWSELNSELGTFVSNRLGRSRIDSNTFIIVERC